MLSQRENVPLRQVNIKVLQDELLNQGAVLIYFKDAKPGDEHYAVLQRCALNGLLPNNLWEAKLSAPMDEATLLAWAIPEEHHRLLRVGMTRGEFLEALWEVVSRP